MPLVVGRDRRLEKALRKAAADDDRSELVLLLRDPSFAFDDRDREQLADFLARERAERGRRKGGRPRRLPAEDSGLRLVMTAAAALYENTGRTRQRLVADVAKHYGVAEGTASRWLARMAPVRAVSRVRKG